MPLALALGLTAPAHAGLKASANGGVNDYQVVLFLDDAPKTNTWGPTTAVLRAEDRTHPSTTGLPATFTSAVSEWYGWSNDLRANANIKVLASVDPTSFPLGTDPNQSWYSGYYPILWTNTQYKMLYANFGHNAMDYGSNTRLSSTFASPTQNGFLIDGLKWLGGVAGSPAPTDPISETTWYSLADSANGARVDARAAATANGTAIQQYTCNGTTAQQLREAPGRYHFTARHSGKCLSTTSSAANGVQLVQRACDNSAAQSFHLTAHP
ncbi:MULTISPECIES: RICIN domain-containing protein [unclassified Streptomyces]|uniref:RICIN domain-containing protein n=1 Tax=unclassified Streptomyces TaxID=2593676 RepID=UPI001EF7E405|nr:MULTISPECIES: RICIN domain-containing protein [unclassified Streptomyces]